MLTLHNNANKHGGEKRRKYNKLLLKSWLYSLLKNKQTGTHTHYVNKLSAHDSDFQWLDNIYFVSHSNVVTGEVVVCKDTVPGQVQKEN